MYLISGHLLMSYFSTFSLLYPSNFIRFLGHLPSIVHQVEMNWIYFCCASELILSSLHYSNRPELLWLYPKPNCWCDRRTLFTIPFHLEPLSWLFWHSSSLVSLELRNFFIFLMVYSGFLCWKACLISSKIVCWMKQKAIWMVPENLRC